MKNKNQAQKTEAQIKQEFEKLHQFLRDEEAARIAELRDEEEQKSNILEESVQKISRELESLSEVIQSLERDMKVADMSFLQGFKDTKMRILSTLDDSKDIYLPLIDTGKHLASLKYRVWEKMLVPLTLEPLSAHPQLSLEDELTSVRYSFRGRHIPDNPERFNLYVYVLGSRGHTSGTHRWEVELGSKPNCRLGAARGSVRRKGNFTVCPQEGFFTVSLRNRELRAGTTPETRLALKRIPHRIRVVLDCDKGEVSFYDPIEMTPLFTFKNTGTEKMYPLFGISKDSAPLRICPVEVSVKPEY
ncbi:hypothetical protein AGOR_G00119560 [Albula goreensis]|uniref:B30.2/SPRY domain-containing protein n=1 Tax=Albula goreensis TaxID=1534307 RepID=A0A8T3DII9_9TELE|nr:hypothetical protein AGOR_G00119560 [Albula goreensis]